MPTPLPKGRRFWRRYTPAPETLRNLNATITEFALALGFVTAVVLILILNGSDPIRPPF